MQEHFRGTIIRRFLDEKEFEQFEKRYNNYKIRELGRVVVEAKKRSNHKFSF